MSDTYIGVLKRCRGCGKLVRHVVTERMATGRYDPDPDPKGNVVFREMAHPKGLIYAHVLRIDEQASDELRFMPHQATCEAARREREVAAAAKRARQKAMEGL